ncbi:hypothetical protein NLS1_32130 [Nocardioides sp. LS1]|nr:hypothetical protein NLS1_32130 [Nocardioides sp. LS1]
MRAARAAGWTFNHIDSAHVFGEIVCPTGQHVKKIFKTGENTETVAIDALNLVIRCPDSAARPPGDKSQVRLESAQKLLGEAELMISSAEDDLSQIEAKEDAEQRFNDLCDLELRIDTAALTLAELEELQDEAFAEATADAPLPAAVEAAITTASAKVETAVAEIKRVNKRGPVKEIHQRAGAARERIAALRVRLSDYLPDE